MRRVKVSKHVIVDNKSTTAFNYNGLFHGWGLDYEECDGGPANYTAAIVERPDGRVALVYPAFLQFDPPSKKD